MTKINRLTQIPTLDDSDLAVVWQDSSERTRAITIANLRKFIQSTDPNSDAFVKAELIGDELVLTSHDETETRIDINILPEHSVTELKDMPDSLVADHYLKVNDAGDGFVLTPASDDASTIPIQEDGQDVGDADVLNFLGLNVSISNKIAVISPAPIQASDGDIMKVQDGLLVPSGVKSKKDGSLSLSSGSVDIGPHTISSAGEGVEATNESTGESYSFVFAGQGDDNGPVDRVLGDESSIETTQDTSVVLVDHTSRLVATGDTRALKKPIRIKPVEPQTNVTMQVTDLNGSDIWTHGPFDMTIDQDGFFEFTISTILDFKVGQYLVTFLSPDGPVKLYGGVSPVSGLNIAYGVIPVKPWVDETLHNIKVDGDIVRVIEAGENVTAEVSEGKLTISSSSSADGYLPLTGGELTGPLVISPEEESESFRINKLDGTELLSAFTGDDSNTISYKKTIQEYEASNQPYEVINRGYGTAKYVQRDGGWIAGDLVVLPHSAYVVGSEFLTNVDYFHFATGTTLSTGDFEYNPQTGEFEGDFYDFAEAKLDHIEFFKIKSKYFHTLATDGTEIIYSNPTNKTVSVKGTLTVSNGDGVKTTVLDSGQASNLLLKWNGQTRVYVGDTSLTVVKKIIANQGAELKGDTTYAGDTTQPTNPITREALDTTLAEYQKAKWLPITTATLQSSGSRPTGTGGTAGVINVWHLNVSDATTSPVNELKTLDSNIKAIMDKVDEDGLNYKLVQGDKVQYWETSSNGWFTSTNDTVWHLSATKCFGDDLESGLETEIYAQYEISDTPEPIEPYEYKGEGEGIPYRRLAGDGLAVQRKIIDHFAGNSNSGNEYLIELDGGNQGSVTYIDGGNITTPRSYKVQDMVTNKSTSKTIRQFERWACHAYLTGDFNTTNFEWHKIDLGTSTFASEAQVVVNNQATIDLMCKSRYGSDCVYINTLTAEV